HYTFGSRFERCTIDPLGQQVHETFDPLQRLISREINHFGARLAETRYTYSPNGHKLTQEETLIKDGQPCGTYAVHWTYDPLGNPLTQEEPLGKTTTYTYAFGRLQTHTKPDGLTLEYNYDPFGRLASLKASDNTLHITYQYDAAGN